MEAADFINKCLARKASHRLGNKGNVEVKQHAWLANFDWQGLYSQTLLAPFVPNPNQVNFDEHHVNNQEWKDAEAVKENEVHLRSPSIQQLFKGYYFDKHHQSNQGTTIGNSAATMNKSTTIGNDGIADTDGALGQQKTQLTVAKTTKNIQHGPNPANYYGTPSFNKDGEAI